MNITSAQYYVDLNNNNAGIRMVENGVTRFVPISTDNADYAALLEWAAEDGNTIEEAD